MRLQSGTDYYLQRIIQESLTDAQRVKLARTFADLKDTFAASAEITTLNEEIEKRKAGITNKQFSLGMDTSPTGIWEANLIPHLDDLPLAYAGGGEQSMMKILLALTRTIEDTHIVLIEEPENHLSYPRLNQLVEKIATHCTGRQVLLTTHSSFVLNKLGLQNLLLLKNQRTTRLTDLPPDTQEYFKRLSGYDTLRMVLADCVILVEGPSDDLIIQRTYKDQHQRLPIQDGIDVISVKGLSFKRFLDIAAITGTRVSVATDNDGDTNALTQKYANHQHTHIKICYSQDETLPSLEPHLVAINTLNDLNDALGTAHPTKDTLLTSISTSANKTDAALKIFEATKTLTMPDYLLEAIAWARQ